MQLVILHGTDFKTLIYMVLCLARKSLYCCNRFIHPCLYTVIILTLEVTEKALLTLHVDDAVQCIIMINVRRKEFWYLVRKLLTKLDFPTSALSVVWHMKYELCISFCLMRTVGWYWFSFYDITLIIELKYMA